MILPDDIDEKIEIWVGETDSEDSESDLSDHETKSTRHHRHPHYRSNSHSQSQSLSRRHSHGRPASASAPEFDGKRDLCRDVERKRRRSRTKEAKEDGHGHVRRLVLGNGLEVKVGRRSPSHGNGRGKGENDNVFILRKQLEAVTSNSNANREQHRQPRQPQYPPGLGLDLGLDESTSSPAKKSHVRRDCDEHAHLQPHQPHSQAHCQPYTHAHTHTHTHTRTHDKSTLSSTSLPSLSRSRRHGQGPIGLGLDLLSNVTRPSRLFTSKRRSSSSLRSQTGTGTTGTAAANSDDDNATVIMPAASTSRTSRTMVASTIPRVQATIERRYSMESIDSSVRGSPRRTSRAHLQIDGSDAAATAAHEKNGASLPRGETARESEVPIDAAGVGVNVNGERGLLQQVRAWAWQLWSSPSSSSS